MFCIIRFIVLCTPLTFFGTIVNHLFLFILGHTEITSPPSLLVEMGNTLTLVCIDFEGAEVEWYKVSLKKAFNCLTKKNVSPR